MNLSRMVSTLKQHKLGTGLFFTAAFLSWITYASFDGSDTLRLTPLTITLKSDSSLPAEVKAQEAATAKNLFDRDTTTDFTAFASNTIHLQLDGSQSVDNLMIFGASTYHLTVRSFNQGIWQDVNEWTNIDLSKLNDGWQSLKTKSLITAEAFEISLVPDVAKGKVSASAAIKEIAFWGKGSRTLITNANSLDTILKQDSATIPAYVKSYNASPEQVIVNSQTASFNLEFPYAPSNIEKTWLSYDAYGVNNWVSARRQINGHTAVGGEYQFTKNQWKTLYEPIHPKWLIQGTNTFQFSLPNDVTGAYRIRNLRLLVLLDDGAHFEKTFIASPQSSLNDAALSHDGDTDTGWQPFLTATDKNKKPSLQFDFAKTMQLDHIRLYALNNLNGSINIDVLVGDTWETGSSAIAGGQISSGWNTFAITSTSAAKALRLTFTDNGKSNLEIREIIPVASGVGELYEPAINVTYPQNGEYFGRSSYIRGYLNVEDNGSGKANLFIGGKSITHDTGEFTALISKEDVQLSEQADDIAWQVTIEAVYPDGTKISKVVLLNNYADNSETQGELPHTIAKATPTDEKLIEYDEASLELTEGAVERPVEIKITSLKHDDLPALDPGMTNVTRGPRRGYRFTPHGTKFKKKIKIKIPYDTSLIPSGMTVADVKTYFFDEETGHWIALEKVGIEKKKKRLISNTDHFTDMINATITVPDSPQAASFNPTQIKDIKAADPGAGINLIEPPQANNQGSANLSYPIEIPAGRNGMQPQLAIQYNSGGGNGWLGLGWDLSVPSITIDTRWGVPRYDNGELIKGKPLETETYMLAGQQMTPLAHRQDQDNLIARQTDKDDFRLRVEGSFQKIKRHGSSPSNYWWEVTDKNGTRYFYGGDGTKQLESAVLGSDKGVFKWMLKETIDTNGNSIRYDYTKVCDSGIGDGDNDNYDGTCDEGTKENAVVPGYNLYLSAIHYTANSSASFEAPYHIEFIRSRGLNDNTTRRPDVSIDARGGFKQVTSQLLKEIKIYYQEELVRGYELSYETGVFQKTRLDAVTQKGTIGTNGTSPDFNLHKFSYYDDVPTTAEGYSAFASTRPMLVPGDVDISRPTFTGRAFKPTLVGGTFGSNQGFNGSFGVTGPFQGTLASGNARHSSNSSKSEGVTALMDMDGDGKPDKVFVSGGKVQYQKNETTIDDQTLTFSDTIYKTNLTQMLKSSTDSTTTGFNGYAYGGTVFRQQMTTTSVEKSFFMDINGDGLIDYVDNGRVKFNYPFKGTDPQKEIDFSDDSGVSPNAIDGGAMAGSGIFDNFSTLEDELREKNPLMDAIKRWVAPIDGRVRIEGSVQLHDFFNDTSLKPHESKARDDYETDDGVYLAIQKNDTEYWRVKIDEKEGQKDYNIYQYSELTNLADSTQNLSSITVNKGDKLYFRVMSNDDGSYDRVNWAPKITYLDDSNTPDHFLDVNNRNVYHYDISADTIFAGQPVSIPATYDGTIHFSGKFIKPVTTDDVTFNIDIYEYDEENKTFSTTPKTGEHGSFSLPMAWDDTQEHNITEDFDVKTRDKIVISFKVDSPIDLTGLSWSVKPEMYYTVATREAITLVKPSEPSENEDAPENLTLPDNNDGIADEAEAFIPEAGGDYETRDPETIPAIKRDADGNIIYDDEGNIIYLIHLPVNFNMDIYSGNNLNGTIQQPWAGRTDVEGGAGNLLIVPWLKVTSKENICRALYENDGFLEWVASLFNSSRCRDLLSTPNGEVTFTVKRRGELLYKQTIEIVDEAVVASTVGYDALTIQHVAANEELFFDFSTRDRLLASRIIDSRVHAEYGSDTPWTVPFTDTTTISVSGHIEDDRNNDNTSFLDSNALIIIREGDNILETREVTVPGGGTLAINEVFDNYDVTEASQLQFDVFSRHDYHKFYSLYPGNQVPQLWTRYLGGSQWSVPRKGKIALDPVLTFKDPAVANGNLIAKVYRSNADLNINNQHIGDREYLVTNGQLTPKDESQFKPFPLAFDVNKNDQLRVEYRTHNHLLSSLLKTKGDVSIDYIDTKNWNVPDVTGDNNNELTIGVTPSLNFDFQGTKPDGEVSFKIMRNNVVLTEKKFTIQKGQLHAPKLPINLTVKENDILHFVFNTVGEELLPFLKLHDVNIIINNNRYAAGNVFNALDIINPVYALHILMPRKLQSLPVQNSARHFPYTDNLFGETYRGWGQAAYLANGDAAHQAITESRLFLPEDEDSYSNFETDVYPAMPSFAEQRWNSADGGWHIGADYIQSTRRGDKSIDVLKAEDYQRDSSSDQTAGIVRVPKFSLSTGYSNGGGYVLTYSDTRTTTFGKMDMMDLNGDRYPDIITEGRVQYTYPDGRMGNVEGVSATRKTFSKDNTLSFGGGTEPPTGPSGRFDIAPNSPPNSDSIPVSGSIGTGSSDGKTDYMDMNGDGLVDKVSVNGNGVSVALNMGYSFAANETWFKPTPDEININKGKTNSYGMGVGWSSPARVFSGGANVSLANNRVSQRLMDMNGDGLTDFVFVNAGVSENGTFIANTVKVAFNLGGKLAEPVVWAEPLKSVDDVNALGDFAGLILPGLSSSTVLADGLSTSVGISGNATTGITFYIPTPGGPVPIFDIVVAGGGSYGETVSQPTVSFTDINGDGYVDSVRSKHDSHLEVKLSQIGRTNMLKSVSRPLGGKFEMEYKRTGNTYNLPQSRWVMSKVNVFDGIARDNPELSTGSDYRVFKYDYQNGKHDRYEREFLGFANVVQEELNTNGVNLDADAANDEVFNSYFKGAVSGAAVYRQSTQTYLNDSFYSKGLLSESTTKGREVTTINDGTPTLGGLVLYRHSKNEYVLHPVAADDSGTTIFPYLKKTENFFYEGVEDKNNTHKSSITEHEYDDYGNVKLFSDLGESATTSDNVVAKIKYSHEDGACLAKHIVGKPTKIVVKDSNGNVLRKRKAKYDCSTGNLIKVKQFLASGSAATTKLTRYDPYGNLTKVVGPVNENKERLKMTFVYDTTTKTYPVVINNKSYNLTSTAEYDYKFGKPLCTIDVNGNPMAYQYDSFGRTTKIVGPYELGGSDCSSAATNAVFTIRFNYNPYVDLATPRTLSVAQTEHYNRDATGAPTNTINTWLYTDGIKRVLQTQKTAEVDGYENAGRIVSGRVSFDALGRSIKQYYPTFEMGNGSINASSFSETPSVITPTKMAYDALDRNISTVLPDNTETSIAYDIAAWSAGRLDNYFITTVTDANTKQKTTYRDVRELIHGVKEEGNLLTTYKYDALKQITDVYDAQNNHTHVDYDNLGRRTRINNPDTGLTQYKYDLASNLIEKITANQKGKVGIKYVYDRTRLKDIIYPTYPANNVHYVYGDESELGATARGENQLGRIAQVSHQGGTDTREYGKLGEVTREVRVMNAVQRGGGAIPTFETRYDFDTFGRLMLLTLPDGEVISNTYNAGGSLYSVEGQSAGKTYPYLTQLTYDEFEQRRSLTLGNGVKTRYHYDPQHRRLCRLESGTTVNEASSNAEGCNEDVQGLRQATSLTDTQSTLEGVSKTPAGQFQNLHYAYDNVGNILGMGNAVTTSRRSDMGGSSSQAFEYDNLYRLTKAAGRFTTAQNINHEYTLDMGYDNIHNITSKNQLSELVRGGKRRTERATTYDWGYQYKTNNQIQPHAPSKIGNREFTYDANGNQLGWASTVNGTRRSIEWDDENRIQKIGDPKNTLTFAYDDSGTRVLKRNQLGQTAYVNQFFTIKNQALASKHIFAGTSRIATKVEPGAPEGRDTLTTTSSTTTFTDLSQTTITRGQGNALAKSAPEKRSFVERVTAFFTGDDANSHPGKGLENRNQRANEVAQNTVKNKHLNGGTLPSGNNRGGNGNNGNNGNRPDNVGNGNNPDTGNGGIGGSNGNKPTQSSGGIFLYYYHPDHLGSTGFVTDDNAELYEHVQYFPFGETWVQQAANSNMRIPYRYTSKELDEETGLYYYGARYYDPRTSVWQSPDPILNSYLGNDIAQLTNNGVFKSGNLGLYSYSYNNSIIYVDPDGNAAKLFKVVYNVVRKAQKNGWDFKKAGKEEIADFVDNLVTLGDGQWNSDDVFATIDLVTGFGKEAKKGLKNSSQIAEGNTFEMDKLQEAIADGKNVVGRTRLVPQNKIGNKKGNRTDTDQLIKNDDKTYSIGETKRTSKTPLSKGQKAAKDHVDSPGNSTFEVRSNVPEFGLKPGDKIQVRDYIRINKYE